MEENLNVDMVLSMIEDDGFRDVWIFYLGCSYHIYLNKDLFSTYKSINGGVVLIGNGTP